MDTVSSEIARIDTGGESPSYCSNANVAEPYSGHKQEGFGEALKHNGRVPEKGPTAVELRAGMVLPVGELGIWTCVANEDTKSGVLVSYHT